MVLGQLVGGTLSCGGGDGGGDGDGGGNADGGGDDTLHQAG